MGSRFIRRSLSMNLGLLLVTLISQVTDAGQSNNYPTECPYPCLPPPTEPTITDCPPPPEALLPPPSEPLMQPPPISQTPPSEIYPPPTDTGYIPYFSPPWFGNGLNSPPPPDPILPYFPWYYKHPLSGQQSSLASTNLVENWFLVHVIVLLSVAVVL